MVSNKKKWKFEDTHTHTQNVKIEATIWVIPVQAKTCQRLPENHNKLDKRHKKRLFLIALRGCNTANSLILDFNFRNRETIISAV